MNRALALALISLLAASGVSADRLVTRDGAVVQTSGTWRVEGDLVVFTLANGQLSSLRLRNVDLEASEAATAAEIEDSRDSATARESAPESQWVITDADVRHVESSPIDPEETAEPAADVAATGASPQERRVEVSRWVRSSDPDVEGLVISGELSNPTAHVAAGIGLEVLLFDRVGELIVSLPAHLTAASLQPGQTARFRCEVPGVFTFSAARFDVESVMLETSSPD